MKSATVTVIDLDSKGLGRMKKWEKLDRDVVKSTLETEASKRVCVEDSASSRRAP